MLIVLKYIAGVTLILGSVATVYFGRKRQNPFYVSWSVFLFAYGVFEIVDALEYLYDTILFFRLLQIFQAFALIMLFAASLEQSMIVSPRASKILAVSLGFFAMYFIIIPLDETLLEFKNLTISIYHTIYTDIYGFIYSFLVLTSALFLIHVFVRYMKLASISKNKRLRLKRDITLIFILMLIALSFLVLIRRKFVENNMSNFENVDIIYSFVVVLIVSSYQSQSMSHGIETILIVDKEGNPLIGYSPIRSRRISFEEKIVAVSGYLSGLFHFVKEYVATTSDEVFRELKTSSSTFSFLPGEKISMIIQTKISSKLLDKTAKMVLEELDKYLVDFEANQIPSEEQINDILNTLEKNFNMIA
ncbi:MAG: hypothetical protein ACTSX6_12615 [Candidatus Heimdallarchaeaceae archaeon]